MVTFNLYPAKMGMGLFAGFLSLCTENLFPLFVTVIVFEFIDFVTGVIKSGVVNKEKDSRLHLRASRRGAPSTNLCLS